MTIRKACDCDLASVRSWLQAASMGAGLSDVEILTYGLIIEGTLYWSETPIADGRLLVENLVSCSGVSVKDVAQIAILLQQRWLGRRILAYSSHGGVLSFFIRCGASVKARYLVQM